MLIKDNSTCFLEGKIQIKSIFHMSEKNIQDKELFASKNFITSNEIL